MTAVLIYALLWLSFGVVHSLLTIGSVKRWLEPVLGSAYRLCYNFFAVAHILLVLQLGRLVLSAERFELYTSWSFVLMSVGLMVGGLIIIVMALKQYDLGQFSGMSQWLAAKTEAGVVALEPLNTSGLNQYVRHPLYSGASLFLWGNATTSFGVWTAIFASAYLYIGAGFEERKLVRLYGQDYTDYQLSVPAFFPRPKAR